VTASSFHTIDWIIIGVYLAAMAGVGIYFSRRQTSIDHYLLADRSMGWLPVGLSLMAALNSGMDYLMQPSATIKYGAVLVLGVTSWLAIYPWVAKVAFPFYHRLNFYTVYEYLEARFDVRVRTMAALIFILWRVGWMATAMYVPSLAVNAATGGQVDLNTMTIIVGVLVTLYTMLGGIQAVIWNDVVQFCIMFGGLAATVAICWFSVPGGLGEIWSVAGNAGLLVVWPPLGDPAAVGVWGSLVSFFAQPMNAVALLVALIVGRAAQYTSDQVMVQRLQTTRSLAEARQAFVVNAAGDALWMLGLSFVGFALFAYFTRHPLPPEFQTDKLVPYFMSLAFPAGAVGLVVAAIMAASLSSIDSAINSCTSVAVVDLYNRVWLGADLRGSSRTVEQERAQVRASRILTVFFGGLGTLLACNVSRIGTLLEINAKVVNAFTGPLFGIFLLAMFSRRARSEGVLLAGAAGAWAAYYVAYQSGLGFMWPSTFGLVATLAAGAAVAVAWPSAADDKRAELTWRAVMNRPQMNTATD
jgi:SSS family solute:Na+ symporter